MIFRDIAKLRERSLCGEEGKEKPWNQQSQCRSRLNFRFCSLFSIAWKYCHHIQIFNEGMVNIKNECNSQSCNPQNNLICNFCAAISLFDNVLTPCHHVWIFYEGMVNFKNGPHIWSCRVRNSCNTIFCAFPSLLDSVLISCHHLLIFNEGAVKIRK